MRDAKLIPLGLIAGAAGSASLPPPASPRSLLSMGWRVTIFGQRALEPIARTLQVFYAPFLLVPLLVSVVAAQVWLYAAGGVVASAQHTLYTPGALLLVVGLLMAGALFHELGHAAALRYGGGTPRSIGAGLYILYPAFFTDVTDGYRLGRWARVRTDLGGVYFHLIFAWALDARDVLAVAAVATQLAILAVAPVATTLLVFGAARAGVAAVARRFGRSYWRGR